MINQKIHNFYKRKCFIRFHHIDSIVTRWSKMYKFLKKKKIRRSPSKTKKKRRDLQWTFCVLYRIFHIFELLLILEECTIGTKLKSRWKLIKLCKMSIRYWHLLVRLKIYLSNPVKISSLIKMIKFIVCSSSYLETIKDEEDGR